MCEEPVIDQNFDDDDDGDDGDDDDDDDYKILNDNESRVMNRRLLEDVILDSAFWIKCYNEGNSGRDVLAPMIDALNALVGATCLYHKDNKKLFEETDVVKRILQNCEVRYRKNIYIYIKR